MARNKQISFLVKLSLLFPVLMVFTLIKVVDAQTEPSPELFVNWNTIKSFSINNSADYMVIIVEHNGRDQMFETRLLRGSWSDPVPINSVNNYGGGNANIGGPSFDYNASIIYFHANYTDAVGGYDIYYSYKTRTGWSEPISLEKTINTHADELYPYMAVGEQKIFFSRRNPQSDARKPRRTRDCQVIYSAVRNVSGDWETPIPLHDAINKACEHSFMVADDGKTVYFSSVDQDNHKESYDIYYAKEIYSNSWMLPVKIPNIASEESNINPRLAGNKLFFLREAEIRRETVGSIYSFELQEEYLPEKTIVSRGRIINQAIKRPVRAGLTVFDPTTLQVIGNYYSDSQSGIYEIPLLDNKNYIVDVRNPGLSFASFQLDYREDEKITGPELIELFDETDLVISVYDGEIFRPLEAEVWAEIITEDSSDVKRKIVKAEKIENGKYSLRLPIGQKYLIAAKASGFKDNEFEFNLSGDIVFSRFERNMPLEPIKIPFEITIADYETKDAVNADVFITNLNREETIFFSAQDIKDGKVTAMLREGDQYEFTIKGAEGYSFHNQVVNLGEEKQTNVEVDLVSLKKETTIRLNNIHFATNSAELNSESFAELDRVVDLMFTNPNIVLEIAAHTDDVGSDAYNMMLSKRRAQSVVNYLLDNEVPEDNIIARGYGLRNPMVPNTTEENRALNRRVEFKILDVQ
ncbi:MAG: OmpA family protein [Bacteroidales bacterium]